MLKEKGGHMLLNKPKQQSIQGGRGGGEGHCSTDVYKVYMVWDYSDYNVAIQFIM